jgi:hypothetical protein
MKSATNNLGLTCFKVLTFVRFVFALAAISGRRRERMLIANQFDSDWFRRRTRPALAAQVRRLNGS